jgi:hypothetical protein
MAFSPCPCPKREKWLRNRLATGKLGEYNKKETIFKGKELCIFIIFNSFFTPTGKGANTSKILVDKRAVK